MLTMLPVIVWALCAVVQGQSTMPTSFGIHAVDAPFDVDPMVTLRLYFNSSVFSCREPSFSIDGIAGCSLKNMFYDDRCDEDGLPGVAIEVERHMRSDGVIPPLLIRAFYIEDETYLLPPFPNPHTASPTTAPTSSPTDAPTNNPTSSPTDAPTNNPTTLPTQTTANPTAAPSMSPSAAPTGTYGCEWIPNNANTEMEMWIGNVTSAAECIDLVQSTCPWANIVNIHGAVFGSIWEEGECWCQYGSDKNVDEGAGYYNCWLFEETGFHWTVGGAMSSSVTAECVPDWASNATLLDAQNSYDIAVSCCSLDGSDGFRNKNDGCWRSKTFDEAVQLCSAEGMRLCTIAEMEADVTKGYGCQNDNRHNWVLDTCDPATTTSTPHRRLLSNGQDSNTTPLPTLSPTPSPLIDPEFVSGPVKGEWCQYAAIVSENAEFCPSNPFDDEGKVCLNEGTLYEAYCSYAFGATACVHCIDLGTFELSELDIVAVHFGASDDDLVITDYEIRSSVLGVNTLREFEFHSWIWTAIEEPSRVDWEVVVDVDHDTYSYTGYHIVVCPDWENDVCSTSGYYSTYPGKWGHSWRRQRCHKTASRVTMSTATLVKSIYILSVEAWHLATRDLEEEDSWTDADYVAAGWPALFDFTDFVFATVPHRGIGHWSYLSPAGNSHNVYDSFAISEVENVPSVTIQCGYDGFNPAARIQDNSCISFAGCVGYVNGSLSDYKYTLKLTSCVGSTYGTAETVNDFQAIVTAKGSTGKHVTTIISAPPMDGVSKSYQLGGKDIGDLYSLELTLKYEGSGDSVSNPYICLQSITWSSNDNPDDEVVMADEHLGAGIMMGFKYAIFGAMGWDIFHNIYVPHPDVSTYPGIHILSTLYPLTVYTDPLRQNTILDLEIRVCSGNPDYGLADPHGLFVQIAGEDLDGSVTASDPIHLYTEEDKIIYKIRSGETRKYALSVPGRYSKIDVLTFSLSQLFDEPGIPAWDPLNYPRGSGFCIDYAAINGRPLSLPLNVMGLPGAVKVLDKDGEEELDEDGQAVTKEVPFDCFGRGETACSSFIYAVNMVPICELEILSEKPETEAVGTTADVVMTRVTCSNPNRLFEVECSVSEEVAIETSSTEEHSYEFTRSRGWDWHMDMTSGFEVTAGYEAEVGIQGLGEASVSQSMTISSSFTYEWGKSGGTDRTNVTTTSDTETEAATMTCEGSVSVPPLHAVDYTVQRSISTFKSTTIAEIRLTKCAAAFPGMPKEDLYIYETVRGGHTMTSGKACSVEFGTATYAQPAPQHCDEAAAMSYDDFPTYTPICNRDDPERWEPCQCAGGDTLTYATCVCVNAVTGNPWTEHRKFGIAVVDPYGANEIPKSKNLSYVHWSGWCEDHCPNSYYPGIPAETSDFIIAQRDSGANVNAAANSKTNSRAATGTDAAVVPTVSESDRQLVRMVLYAAFFACVLVGLACLAAAILLFRRICAGKSRGFHDDPMAAAVQDFGASKAVMSGGGISEMEMGRTLAIVRDDDTA